MIGTKFRKYDFQTEFAQRNNGPLTQLLRLFTLTYSKTPLERALLLYRHFAVILHYCFTAVFMYLEEIRLKGIVYSPLLVHENMEEMLVRQDRTKTVQWTDGGKCRVYDALLSCFVRCFWPSEGKIQKSS